MSYVVEAALKTVLSKIYRNLSMLMLTWGYVCLPAKLVWRNYALADLLETWRLDIGVRNTDATFRESYAVVLPIIWLSIKYAGVLLGRGE
jgi:hypothetical protein